MENSKNNQESAPLDFFNMPFPHQSNLNGATSAKKSTSVKGIMMEQNNSNSNNRHRANQPALFAFLPSPAPEASRKALPTNGPKKSAKPNLTDDQPTLGLSFPLTLASPGQSETTRSIQQIMRAFEPFNAQCNAQLQEIAHVFRQMAKVDGILVASQAARKMSQLDAEWRRSMTAMQPELTSPWKRIHRELRDASNQNVERIGKTFALTFKSMNRLNDLYEAPGLEDLRHVNGIVLQNKKALSAVIESLVDGARKGAESSNTLLPLETFRGPTDFWLGARPRLKQDSLDAALEKVKAFKGWIENQGGHRTVWNRNKPVLDRESKLQSIFYHSCEGSPFDVNAEPNNGRGPVDFKFSFGSGDKCLVEFKLANDTNLKQKLQNQLPVYLRANGTEKGIYVIIYFTEAESKRVTRVLAELGMDNMKEVVVIDARRDNKPSGSKA